MGKSISNDVFDAALAIVAACTRMDVLSDAGTPANLTNTLANVTLTAGSGNGDYTIADGDSSGRKVTVLQQADVAITNTGTANHIALSNAGAIKLATTVSNPQTLTSGGTVTIQSFKWEVADPT